MISDDETTHLIYTHSGRCAVIESDCYWGGFLQDQTSLFLSGDTSVQIVDVAPLPISMLSNFADKLIPRQRCYTLSLLGIPETQGFPVSLADRVQSLATIQSFPRNVLQEVPFDSDIPLDQVSHRIGMLSVHDQERTLYKVCEAFVRYQCTVDLPEVIALFEQARAFHYHPDMHKKLLHSAFRYFHSLPIFVKDRVFSKLKGSLLAKGQAMEGGDVDFAKYAFMDTRGFSSTFDEKIEALKSLL